MNSKSQGEDSTTQGCSSTTVSSEKMELSDSQVARIERNRQKALLLKQSRLMKRPVEKDSSQNEHYKIPKVIDTGAGFLLEESEEDKKPVKVNHLPGPVLGEDMLFCEDCDKEFMESYLYNHFDSHVCDKCRKTEEKHALITKTEAKSKYFLKDVDLEKREPALKFIVKKNNRNDKWGDMKLYLELQVAQRALEVWGSEDGMEEERERRSENKVKLRKNKFDKRVKELRKAVRSSLFKKDTSSHEHEYGPETYNEEEDEYSKTCKTCGQTLTYEKM